MSLTTEFRICSIFTKFVNVNFKCMIRIKLIWKVFFFKKSLKWSDAKMDRSMHGWIYGLRFMD